MLALWLANFCQSQSNAPTTLVDQHEIVANWPCMFSYYITPFFIWFFLFPSYYNSNFWKTIFIFEKKKNIYVQTAFILSWRTNSTSSYIFFFFALEGMQQSPEFANELLRALRGTRDWKFHITKCELHCFWCRMMDPFFDSRIQIFFDL